MTITHKITDIITVEPNTPENIFVDTPHGCVAVWVKKDALNVRIYTTEQGKVAELEIPAPVLLYLAQ